MSQINAARGEDAMAVDDESSDDSDEDVSCICQVASLPCSYFFGQKKEEFYSPGSLELLEARRRIAEYSLPRLDLRYLWVTTRQGAYYTSFCSVFLAELKSESPNSE